MRRERRKWGASMFLVKKPNGKLLVVVKLGSFGEEAIPVFTLWGLSEGQEVL